MVRSVTVPTQQGNAIELESGDRRTQQVTPSHHTRWIDNIDLSSSQDLSRGTVAEPERDDILLMGVKLQRKHPRR